MPSGPGKNKGHLAYHAMRALTKDNPTEVLEFFQSVMRGNVLRTTRKISKQTGMEIDETEGPTISQRLQAAEILAAYQYGRPAETHNLNVDADVTTRAPNLKLLTTEDLERLHALASKADAIDAEYVPALPETVSDKT